MSTIKSVYLQHLNGTTPNATMDTNGNFTVGGTVSGASSNMFRNRIINGDMRIDQRNAGGSVTFNDEVFSVDRWRAFVSQTGKLTSQQNAGSVTRPAGFVNYIGLTSSSSYSVGTSEIFALGQMIEGLNIFDLAWGTSDAKPVTLSFWVRSSLTGTFGGSLQNSGRSQCYPFSYTISSANTWTSISITITGPTSGTWLSTNGIGIQVNFGLGSGSTYSGTAGSWSSSNLWTATGAVSVVGTNGATFYITGVQLEVGSSATPFEFRHFTTELQLCQRYYQKSYNIDVVPGTATTTGTSQNELQGSGTYTVMYQPTFFKTTMRASPTVTLYDDSGNAGKLSTNPGSQNGAVQHASMNGFSGGFGVGTGSVWNRYQFTAVSEL